jgi:hypothetical protein
MPFKSNGNTISVTDSVHCGQMPRVGVSFHGPKDLGRLEELDQHLEKRMFPDKWSSRDGQYRHGTWETTLLQGLV